MERIIYILYNGEQGLLQLIRDKMNPIHQTKIPKKQCVLDFYSYTVNGSVGRAALFSGQMTNSDKAVGSLTLTMYKQTEDRPGSPAVIS